MAIPGFAGFRRDVACATAALVMLSVSTPLAGQSIGESGPPPGSHGASVGRVGADTRTEVALLRDEIADLRRQVEDLTADVRALRPAAVVTSPQDQDVSRAPHGMAQAPAADPAMPVRITG